VGEIDPAPETNFLALVPRLSAASCRQVLDAPFAVPRIPSLTSCNLSPLRLLRRCGQRVRQDQVGGTDSWASVFRAFQCLGCGTLLPDLTFEALEVDIPVTLAIAVSDAPCRPGSTS